MKNTWSEYHLRSFNLDNPDLIFIMRNIIEQLAIKSPKRKYNHRCRSIAIEGPKNIGKTQFIFSFLDLINRPFNFMNGKFDFSKKNYDDTYEVDVFKNFTISKVFKEEKKIFFFGCNQKLANVSYAGGHMRQIMSDKLCITLWNPENSFFEQLSKIDQMYKDYINPNTIYIRIHDNKLLYNKNFKDINA
ncbi:MAG: hypothetical protein Q8764_02610 [Pigeon pea little leaf phytoplasma]|uniref:Uncharacterized protein n=1 Tax=Candidatus Phytoplasma fabacearum TaxID=2982628 RepID=A0ABU8ZTI0_9MOLU|nr:hypothetical protein ['Bituminaria bituminosa' little leaf phytoplasma]MDV3154324.1 hypothetical protein [Pigeon pea little leaf phytoplasma]MDO7983832.1 hypothetical protein ['Bituminaria bituminosa' little leaf phytoplasma]MDO8024152.1 hypothetical protein ['Bituminaria bituminosa' little leaf phytoplasma]MDO8030840.1 hypothetical protein ['Bituminaria bituminosa' little leaf phytoplasma]MDV3158868.1 hypothetical protein [Pigeon pea little leaf phytoplasma]